MVKHSLHRLTRVRTGILSDQDGVLEIAHRELLDLRERVEKAELTAKSVRSRGESQSPPKRSVLTA